MKEYATLLLTGKRAELWPAGWLLALSSFSYPLYLLHQMIGFAIIWHLRKLGIEGEWMILVPIGFNVMLAILIHNHIEKNKSLNVVKI